MNDRFEELKQKLLPRFWGTEKNTMVYPEISRNEIFYTQNPNKPNILIEDTLNDLLINPRFIPMKPTGMFDKNGKLVFEGDLVKTESGVYEIMWFKGTFNAVGLLDGVYLTTDINNIDDGEIIGNTYENKDLLEQ